MTNVTRVKLEGLEELKANLAALGEEVATKVGVRANREAAKAMAVYVKAFAPVGTGPTLKRWKRKDGSVGSADYGRLNENIRVRRARARSENTITFNISTGRAFWGSFLEFGTVNMPAQPWMRPAVDAGATQGLNVQIEELRKGIERATKRMRVSRRVLPNGRNG
jgi:HK97 gp10 family phage protein